MEFLWIVAWVIAALFVISTVLNIVGRRHDRQLALARSGIDPDEFIGYFTRQGIPRPIAEITRAYFREWMGIADFPVLPADNIADVYGMVDEDLEATFFEVLDLCGRRDKPDEGEMGCPTINTVEDLVKLIALLTTPEKCDIVTVDDPVDYQSRARLALLLRRFAIGRITYLEFEQGVNALSWNRKDGAIPGVVSEVRGLLHADTEMRLSASDDYRLQERIPLDRELKRALARSVMFLYSDQPYLRRWQKHLTVGETVFVVCSLAASAALFRSGYAWAATALLAFIAWLVYELAWAPPSRGEAMSSGAYPFADNVHFFAARWRPRLLAGRPPI
ncbi:MAG TPA: hypothetical protein VGM51_09390 [Armatimonadota bacterium]|jgi:hypothetical protein